MHIRLQSTVGDFDASFVKALRKFEKVMEAQGLDPSVYVISKDRPQFTSLPFFVRPGGDGYNYTVFIDGESFTVTKVNDLAFLDHFEQLCAGAIYGKPESGSLFRTIGQFFGRIRAWFDAPLYEKPKK
ncbi:MAG: hypothetical protein J0I29_06725 [Rhizobiales bacterium]|nr:hypothetical protein [Hyphomicrobiales bacterium]